MTDNDNAATPSPDSDDEEEEKPLPPPPNPKFTIPIHTLIETSQSSHGLRHDDYNQYRSYCTRRLSRLRHNKLVLKDLSHSVVHGSSSSSSTATDKKSTNPKKGGGKHAFLPRTLHPVDATKHVNVMLVTLYSAERCWSHGMELKRDYEDALSSRSSSSSKTKKKDTGVVLGIIGEKSKSSAGSIRQHYISKLKKAAKYATDLEEMSKVAGDDRTAVECRAYASWMRGNAALEKGDWQTACTEYGSALTICQALGSGGEGSEDITTTAENNKNDSTATTTKHVENLELRDFFTARAEHVIQPLLRYCQYELQEGGMMNQNEIISLMKTQAETESEFLLNQNQLFQSKLDSMRDEKLQSEASEGSMSSIQFRSNTIPIENKNVRVALLKIVDLKKDLQQEKSTKKKDAKFLALLTGYDDAISMVSADLKDYQGMKSGPAVNAKRFECENLLGYVKYEKLKLLMKRNEDMVNGIREKDRRFLKKSSNGGGSSGSAGAGGGKKAVEEEEDETTKRVEEIAHLYDALLQDARSIATLPGGGDISTYTTSGEEANSADHDAIEDEFVLEANANVLRIRALRCYYVARMYASSTLEKYVEASVLFEQASSLANQAAEEIGACQDMEDGDELVESMEELEKEIKGAKFRAEACAYLAKAGRMGSSSSSSSTTTTSAGKGGGRSLLHRLDDFDSGGKTFHLADVPPSLEPIPCKPTFFDIALNHVGEFPMDNLQAFVDEYAAEQKQSRGLLGWFRRG